MSNSVGTTPAKVKAYGFLIDPQGMPKVDNPLEVPKYDWGTLTQKEKDHVNGSVMEHLRRFD